MKNKKIILAVEEIKIWNNQTLKLEEKING